MAWVGQPVTTRTFLPLPRLCLQMAALQIHAEHGPGLDTDPETFMAGIERFVTRQVLMTRPREEWRTDVGSRYVLFAAVLAVAVQQSSKAARCGRTRCRAANIVGLLSTVTTACCGAGNMRVLVSDRKQYT